MYHCKSISPFITSIPATPPGCGPARGGDQRRRLSTRKIYKRSKQQRVSTEFCHKACTRETSLDTCCSEVPNKAIARSEKEWRENSERADKEKKTRNLLIREVRVTKRTFDYELQSVRENVREKNSEKKEFC